MAEEAPTKDQVFVSNVKTMNTWQLMEKTTLKQQMMLFLQILKAFHCRIKNKWKY